MRRWQSHKIVEAEPITGWADTITNKHITTGEDMAAYRHEVPENFFARGKPQIGDYLVRYDTGQETEYLSWSPKKAFEDGYTPLDEVDLKMGEWKVIGSPPPPARDKLVRFLIDRIASFKTGYETSADATRMEELSWLLLQAVGGQIL